MPTIRPVPDAMSDVLSLVKMRCGVVCANDFAAPFSLDFHRPGAQFHILERGAAFLVFDGEAPIRVGAGDLLILPLGEGHVLTTDPTLRPVPVDRAIQDLAVRHGSVLQWGRGNGAQTRTICGQFYFEGVLAPRLLAVLPALIHIREQDARPLEWLRLISHFLSEETRRADPGANMMTARLLELMFIQALREWGAHGPQSAGWLSGLLDQHLGKALSAIHDEPARDWTVESLATLAGLSRAAFAARFPAVVGQPPLQYLTTWRLNLAADQLRIGTARIAEIAEKVGYGSEAALVRAFKAQFGTTPAAFRRGLSPMEATAT